MFQLRNIKSTNFLLLNVASHVNINGKTSFHSCSLNAAKQIGVAMKKIMGMSSKKRKFQFSEESSIQTDAFTRNKNNVINPRRAVVLNKLFMRNITDLMATGEYSSKIVGLGIEVIRVTIAHDYKILKVYWVTNSEKGNEAEEILQKTAGFLRHELSTLRLMGHIPKIQFVKDKNYAQLLELDKRLSLADYGEEGPNDVGPAAYLISECTLSVPIEKEVKVEIAKLEKLEPFKEEELHLTELPPMNNCVFGLDYEAIMKRVQNASSKSKNNYTGDGNWASYKLKQYSNIDGSVFGSESLQRDAFNKFLQQRQLLKFKEKRRKNEPPIKFVQEEPENDLKNDFYDNIDNDFVEESSDEI